MPYIIDTDTNTDNTAALLYSNAYQKLKQATFFIELATQLMDGCDRENAYHPLSALVEEVLTHANQGLHNIVQSYIIDQGKEDEH
jgi:hypothetical protein